MYDRYWKDYDIFIGIVKYSIQNGWNSQKDLLTTDTSLSFNVSEDEFDRITRLYNHIVYNKSKLRWILFNYNS